MPTRTLDRRRLDSPHRSPVLDRFGLAVRARRQALGMTREEVGTRAGIHPKYIGDIERGEVNPTLLTLQRVADGLGTPLPDLLADAARG